jgi:hypothetical protein
MLLLWIMQQMIFIYENISLFPNLKTYSCQLTHQRTL